MSAPQDRYAPRSPLPLDERPDPPFLDAERPALDSWLELYRRTLPLKVGGLTGEQLCRRTVPPSSLSLLGIVRHLTKVERYWADLAVGLERPFLYGDTDPEGDFTGGEPATALDDLQRFGAEVARARSVAEQVRDLDRPLLGRRHGEPLNLRWVLLHLIEEYARHLGHADLLRECLDGATGY